MLNLVSKGERATNRKSKYFSLGKTNENVGTDDKKVHEYLPV